MEAGSAPHHRIIVTLDDRRISGHCDWRWVAKIVGFFDIISSLIQFVFSLLLTLTAFSAIDKADHPHMFEESQKLGQSLLITLTVWAVVELVFACVLIMTTNEKRVFEYRVYCLVIVIVWLWWIFIGTCFHGWVAIKVMDMDETRVTTTILQMIMFGAVIPYARILSKPPKEEEDKEIFEEEDLNKTLAALAGFGTVTARRASSFTSLTSLKNTVGGDEKDDAEVTETTMTSKDEEEDVDSKGRSKKKRRKSVVLPDTLEERRAARKSSSAELSEGRPKRRSSVAASDIRAVRKGSSASTVAKKKRGSDISEVRHKRRSSSVASTGKGKRRSTSINADEDGHSHHSHHSHSHDMTNALIR